MAEAAIRAQLRAGPPRQPTLYDRACDLADTSNEGPKEAGRYGAHVGKVWGAWLITVLTDHALREAGVLELATRERVRDWQRRILGRALSSRALARYAQPLGYSGPDFVVPAAIEERAQELFRTYRRALRQSFALSSVKARPRKPPAKKSDPR
jgi:hypothetical protein